MSIKLEQLSAIEPNPIFICPRALGEQELIKIDEDIYACPGKTAQGIRLNRNCTSCQYRTPSKPQTQKRKYH